MAFVQCQFFSNALGLSMTMNAILPQSAGEQQIGIGAPEKREFYPVLYLLHGLSDDHSIWSRRTSIELYAAQYNLAIVMPAVHRSWYTDKTTGEKYWTYISEEVPALAEHFFPISRKREERYVAGLSMGGYGAFKLALRCPEKFAAAASLSGALDLVELSEGRTEEEARELDTIFGGVEALRGSENDLLAVARKLAQSDRPRPKLWQCCGTEDFLYQDNQNFREIMQDLGFTYEYHEGPGEHTWAYWDQEIKNVLAWLPL